ncbi:MAG: hypothetical protein KKC03_06570 [Bacteroidetes bacterium]|nr:hypothetical protein [Bacteroidota bacterium]
MAKVSLASIKNWFKTGLKPTQAQFWDVWDSFRHKDDLVPAAEVEGLDGLLNDMSVAVDAANRTKVMVMELSEAELATPDANGVAAYVSALPAPFLIVDGSTVQKFRIIESGDVYTIVGKGRGVYGAGNLQLVATDLLYQRAVIKTSQLMNDGDGFSPFLSFFPNNVTEVVVRDVLGVEIGRMTNQVLLKGLAWDDITKTLSASGNTNTNATGAIDGTNRIFAAPAAFEAGKSEVFLNGIRQRLGSGFDYIELDTQTIQFETAPTANPDAWVLIK